MRKKSLVAVLTAMLLLFNVGMAMASPFGSGTAAIPRPITDDMLTLDFFMEPQNTTQACEDELHEILALETATLELRLDEVELRDNILSRLVSAYDNEYTTAIENARRLQRDITPINQEIRDLNSQIATEWQSFHTAAVDEDTATAKTHLDNIIGFKNQVNDRIQDKIEILEDIKSVLTPL